MVERWNPLGFQLSFFGVLILLLEIQECDSLNSEGLALLKFRASVDKDPYGAFANWNPNDTDPCMWLGVQCVDKKVQMLHLGGFSLEGTLAPELVQLTQLRSLALYKNRFSGFIAKEIGGLNMLELLDLRYNNLSGTIPAEIGRMMSLKHLLLFGNNFQGSIPLELEKLNVLSHPQYNQNLTFAGTIDTDCINRKFGHCIWRSSLRQLENVDSYITPIKGTLLRYLDVSPLFKFGRSRIHEDVENGCRNLPSLSEPLIGGSVQDMVNIVHRRLLEASTNLPAADASDANPSEQLAPVTLHSGAFPVVKNFNQSPSSPLPLFPAVKNFNQSPSSPLPLGSGSSKRIYVFVSVAFVLTLSAVIFVIRRNRQAGTTDALKTGLRGPSQKAFVSAITKLNRFELGAACEDFSNIINILSDCIVYKGTLSSGVEVAVVSTTVALSEDWSNHAEKAFRQKIDTLSRVSHKNFVNLLGYCDEDEPFTRMMVFQYAPNGTLYEHLHVTEAEHLDWNARVRIIMGMAYCLEYMHHDLNPPVAHPNLQSDYILLTDDYAAKIADICFWTEIEAKSEIPDEEESEHCHLLQGPSPQVNIYSFGLMLLEIISGKVTDNEKEGSLVNWASDYLGDKQKISNLIDPTLKSFKTNELSIICEVIQMSVYDNLRQRLTMKEITSKLREVITISRDAATPKLSPLWWAELEILSIKST